MRIKKAGIALTAATALVLSACSSSTDGGKSAEDSANSSENALPAADYNEVDPAELQDGGTLRLSVGDLPVNWNGMQVDGNNVDTSNILGWVSPISSNWIFAEDGSFDVNPNYVESYEVNDAPEGGAAMEVTLKLNPEAKWNDGTPITVKDYQATWDACNDTDSGFKCASTDGWTAIDAIEAGADEFEVVVKFNIAYPDWSANLSGVWPAAGVGDAETFNTGWVDGTKINDWLAGPFKIESIDTGAGLVTLTRNENWWGDTPKLDTVTFRVLDQAGTGQAFANGELDYLGGIVDSATYELAKSNTDATIKMSTSVQWRHYTLNSRAESLKDVKVRQAIARGIDRADVTASDLAGLPTAELDVLLGNHFFMPGQAGYQDNAPTYDVEAAKALLEEAGYTFDDASGYYQKDGKNLTVKYLRITGTAASENEGAKLQEYMKDLGIEVVFVDTISDDFFNLVIAGDYEITSFAWQGTPYPMANVGQIYGKPFDASGNLVNSNFSGLEVPEVDEYVTKIAGEVDGDARMALTNEVDKIIWDNVFNIPLYYRADIAAVTNTLANFGARAFKTFLPEHIGFTK